MTQIPHKINTEFKMADDVDRRLEGALNTLLSITEKSGNLRNDLRKDIVDSVSTLRNIFVNLKNSVAEHMGKITQLVSEVKTVRAELQGSRAANQSARSAPSMNRMGGNSRKRGEARAAIFRRYETLLRGDEGGSTKTVQGFGKI